MGKLAEMQRKLLEVSQPCFVLRHRLTDGLQQMMGPEAMGTADAHLHWKDEKVCRNFLCGTCPHVLFTNTVSAKLDLVLDALFKHLAFYDNDNTYLENGSWCMP